MKKMPLDGEPATYGELVLGDYYRSSDDHLFRIRMTDGAGDLETVEGGFKRVEALSADTAVVRVLIPIWLGGGS